MFVSKKIRFYLIILFIILIAAVIILFFKYMKMNKNNKGLSTRQPVVAGAFYPADKDILSQQIDDFLKQVKDEEINGDLRMLILPHAGYEFSGQTAAYGFKKLIGQNFKTVVLIGPSHSDWFYGAALSGYDYWQTPLGIIKINKELVRKLTQENKDIFVREQAHKNEHCLEVMLPFLQKVLKRFEILPIIISRADDEFLAALAQVLQKHLTDQDLVIISSDLSHYPSYSEAQKIDKKTIEGILTGKAESFEKTIQENMERDLPNLDTCACGEEPIKVGLFLAKEMGWDNIKLLNYASSGDVGGDYSRVVGYAAIAFSNGKQISKKESSLSPQEKQILLKIARQSIENSFKNKKSADFDGLTERLKQPQGAFVTLNKNGQLRGCMGRIIEEKEPLYQVVAEMARVAAFEDPRFYPVKKEEIKEIDIEISVLSPLKKITDPLKEVEIGEHGVIVQKGFSSGVFLPQVATENNWDLETFMNELCEHKAGLPRDAWKTRDIDIYIFSAEVFSE